MVAAELERGVEQLLRPRDDVGCGVAGPPDGDAGRGRGLDPGPQPLCGLRRTGRRGPREDDGEPAVVEPRDEVELARGADEAAERLVRVPSRHAHEHERERLPVLPRRGGEPAELVEQVRLVVDAGERVAAGRLARRGEQEHPAAYQQEGGDGEHEHDRLRGRLAARALDDEHDEDDDQRGAHARRRPDAERRPALGPVRAAADPERGGDRRKADQARLQLPADVDQAARAVVPVEDEVGVDAVGDPARDDRGRDEPAGERARGAPPRAASSRSHRARRGRAPDS